MEDIDWDSFPCMRVAFYTGFHRVSAVGITVVGPVQKRVPDGLEYTPDCVSFDSLNWRETYSMESWRWKNLNDKPGLLEEVPWTKAQIKELVKKRESEE